MKIFLKWFLIIGFLIFLVTVMSTWTSDIQVKNPDVNKIQYVKIAGVKFKVDLASTPAKREQGLSGRKKLKKDEGMLFIFNNMGKYSFWMKDMNFNIDIIWIGKNFNVVYIKKNALPESYPKIFTPQKNSKYVLEVSSIFLEKNNLKEGDKVEFLSF